MVKLLSYFTQCCLLASVFIVDLVLTLPHGNVKWEGTNVTQAGELGENTPFISKVDKSSVIELWGSTDLVIFRMAWDGHDSVSALISVYIEGWVCFDTHLTYQSCCESEGNCTSTFCLRSSAPVAWRTILSQTIAISVESLGKSVPKKSSES